MIAKVCDRESRRDSWFENRLVLNVIIYEESAGTGLGNIEATFEFDLCTNYIVIPRLPVQDETWQQYEIVILGPLPT